MPTATRPATRTCSCFSSSVLASWVFYIYIPPSHFFYHWFSALSLVFHFSLFPHTLIAIAAYLLIWFSCTNTACLSCSRTLPPIYPHAPYPCFHQGLSIRQKYLYALTLHNRRRPDRFLCDHVTAYNSPVGVLYSALALTPVLLPSLHAS